MKLKKGLILRKVANNYCVVAVGELANKFKGMINLNATGAFLFELLQKETSLEELTNKMMEKYDIDKEQASQDVSSFVEALKGSNLVE